VAPGYIARQGAWRLDLAAHILHTCIAIALRCYNGIPTGHIEDGSGRSCVWGYGHGGILAGVGRHGSNGGTVVAQLTA
jgi:hypothetical protein